MKKLVPLLLLLPLMSVAGPSEQQRAKELVERGEILPLTDIIAQARAVQPGRILEVELEREDGVWLYELEVLDDQGQIWELRLDARSGDMLKREREN